MHTHTNGDFQEGHMGNGILVALGKDLGAWAKGISFPSIFSCLVLLELIFYHEHVLKI